MQALRIKRGNKKKEKRLTDMGRPHLQLLLPLLESIYSITQLTLLLPSCLSQHNLCNRFHMASSRLVTSLFSLLLWWWLQHPVALFVIWPRNNEAVLSPAEEAIYEHSNHCRHSQLQQLDETHRKCVS